MNQKCVEKIVIEPNQWTYKGGNDLQVSIYFKWNKPVTKFRYCPKSEEIRRVILFLSRIYGKEYVEKEIGIKILVV
jgi:hypothetical protein